MLSKYRKVVSILQEKTPPMRTTLQDKQAIIELANSGKSSLEIAETLGLTVRVVRKWRQLEKKRRFIGTGPRSPQKRGDGEFRQAHCSQSGWIPSGKNRLGANYHSCGTGPRACFERLAAPVKKHDSGIPQKPGQDAPTSKARSPANKALQSPRISTRLVANGCGGQQAGGAARDRLRDQLEGQFFKNLCEHPPIGLRIAFPNATSLVADRNRHIALLYPKREAPKTGDGGTVAPNHAFAGNRRPIVRQLPPTDGSLPRAPSAPEPRNTISEHTKPASVGCLPRSREKRSALYG